MKWARGVNISFSPKSDMNKPKHMRNVRTISIIRNYCRAGQLDNRTLPAIFKISQNVWFDNKSDDLSGVHLGLHFTPVTDVPVYHPDVRVWKVTNGASELVGLWYFDPYARPGKRSGAWMNAYRSQERFEREIRTIVSNNSNFVKGRRASRSWSAGPTPRPSFTSSATPSTACRRT